MTVLSPDRLFDGERIRPGAAVAFDGACISAAPDTAPPGAIRLSGLLAPGFIDLQVNGGGGVLFSDAPGREALRTLLGVHMGRGATGVMASLISSERTVMTAAMSAVREALRYGQDGLLGLHLEGPWLAPSRRGVHPASVLRPMDEDDMDLLTRQADFPLMVTLAPECASPAQIARLVAAGVRVSLGHTAADVDTVMRAIDAGASGFTHLFNAMPPLDSRQPGPVGAALSSADAWAGLILDGIHVHPAAARSAYLAKTAQRLMLISDAMPSVGGPQSLTLFGETVRLSGGALRTASGVLAGAHLDMAGAVRNAVRLMGASEADALRMATLSPACFLGVDAGRGRIAPGARADFVLLDEELNVTGVWTGGRRLTLGPASGVTV